MGRLKALYKSMRMAYLTTFRYKLISAGPGLYVGWRVYIKPNAVKVGHRVFIGPESFLSSAVTIGNWVMLAGRVSIVGGDHRFDVVGTPMIDAGRDVNKEVFIEDDVWIGHQALIMHGVRIGEGAIVAAGSVVTKDVEPYSIVAGVPAKMLRMRFEPEQITAHRAELEQLRAKL